MFEKSLKFEYLAFEPNGSFFTEKEPVETLITRFPDLVFDEYFNQEHGGLTTRDVISTAV